MSRRTKPRTTADLLAALRELRSAPVIETKPIDFALKDALVGEVRQ